MGARVLTIYRVRPDATVDTLGAYDPDGKQLTLQRPGFPLAPIGPSVVDGDLPWPLVDLAPAGYLAARFTRWFPELNLPPRRDTWQNHHFRTAISRAGHDLPGNLIVGEESLARYTRIFVENPRPGPAAEAASEHYAGFVEQILADPLGSTVGGERPKFTLRLEDGRGLLVKFTPPLDTPFGRRWADLLRMEAHCAAVLGASGIAAASSRYVEVGDRGFLEVDRYDRVAGGGRIGAYTLYWLGAALYGQLADPMAVVRGLVDDGHLPASDLVVARRVHAFSAAIGNTDAHQGNYGVTVDVDGRLALAPIYDVSPMVFAPRNDELPDARVRPIVHPDRSEVGALVDRLAARVAGDDAISTAFRERWTHHVGR